jgi:hypothetical protein
VVSTVCKTQSAPKKKIPGINSLLFQVGMAVLVEGGSTILHKLMKNVMTIYSNHIKQTFLPISITTERGVLKKQIYYMSKYFLTQDEVQ